MMPNALPPCCTVFQQTQSWLKAGVFEAMVHDLRQILRWLSGIVLAVLLLGIMNATQVILPRTVLADNLAYSTAEYVKDHTEEQNTIRNTMSLSPYCLLIYNGLL